ncbi:MAG: apolipoprotein N-acyltransferase [Candidatus Omnitrophica bacterium CG11_big_fil_rev_8_21_14_0_20_42_13]|uniref:Apolipoprotein N-acyltransferase n=1 Tax=Candidatus Ghiorseimicrobium undicola TaxID=1974746 RepID=A0A2H0LUZ9_9BACT|nr:MAG: apolipoprotein N-acyltransferase [Candidatus Omnitrophica bacterium CG11_big_fil_rev_8_21_14_0_20_42_13]
MLRQVIQFIFHSPRPIVKRLFLSFLSAVLLALPFRNPNLWLFAWFGFVPLFFAIKEQSKGKVFFLAYFTGVVFWLSAIYWLTNVTIAGYIILSSYLALYFGIFGSLLSFYSILNTQYSILFIPAAWACLEYIRAYLLTGFPWALLGYSQYQNLPVMQIADIGGAYAVSFLVIMVNTLIYNTARIAYRALSKSKIDLSPRFCLIPIFVLFLSIGYGFLRLNSIHNTQYPILKVSLVQPNIAQDIKWDPALKDKTLNKLFLLTEKAAQEEPGLIIWPETSVQDFLMIKKGNYYNPGYLSDFIAGLGRPFLTGIITVLTGNDYEALFFNSAVLFSGNGEVLERYDKLHLVPFGEYIPLRKKLPFIEKIVPIDDFSRGKEYTVFEPPAISQRLPVKFSTLICFEDVFGNLARNFAKRGARFLVNITNDAWFMDTAEPYQHLAASVFRAVENRVSVVRSANTGISCFIAPSGRIKSRVSDYKGKDTFVAGHLTDVVVCSSSGSIYTEYGDAPVFLCFIVLLSLMAYKARKAQI